MKRTAGYILLLVSTLLLAACGTREALIEASAAEMNLTPEDLGRPAAVQDRPMQEILRLVQQAPETRLARDANMRTFSFSDTEVIAVILVTSSSAEARAALRDARSNFESGLRDALGQGTTVPLEALTVPQLGDETFFARVQLPGDKGPGYILGFRKNNVAGLIIAYGPPGALDEDWLRGLGQKMFQRLPEPKA
ncbi:MAG: hypothetical protein ACP5SI_05485 [Chloroflexia bacterium]